MADVYAHPTLAGFAARLDALAASGPVTSDAAPKADPGLVRRHALCGFAQALSLYPLLLLSAPPWIFAWVVYHFYVVRESDDQVALLTLAGAAAVLGFAPVRMALAIAVKWLVLGRVKPGRRRLWGFWYWRFWFVNRVLALAESRAMRGTPWQNFYYRCLGAKVAKDAHIETTFIGVPDLVEIGAGASVGHDASLLGYTVEGGDILLGRIVIGAGATLGSKCLLSPDTRVGAGAELADGTLLTPGMRVPDGELWEGSPARRIGRAEKADDPAAGRYPFGLKAGFAFAHVALALIPAIAAPRPARGCSRMSMPDTAISTKATPTCGNSRSRPCRPPRSTRSRSRCSSSPRSGCCSGA